MQYTTREMNRRQLVGRFLIRKKMTHEEKQIHNAVHAELKEFEVFKELVKRMREAQTEKEIVEMRLKFKINQHEKISDGDNVEFATAMCNVVFYEDKVDEHIEKMEIRNYTRLSQDRYFCYCSSLLHHCSGY